MANATALFAVQKAVFTAINVAAVTNVFAGSPAVSVYDAVPEGQSYPYVEIGELEERLNNIFAKNGRELHVTLHVYSQASGYLEAEKIIEQLNVLLDDTLLNTDSVGWKCWQSEYEEGSLQKEFDDREMRHAIVKYHIEVTAP